MTYHDRALAAVGVLRNELFDFILHFAATLTEMLSILFGSVFYHGAAVLKVKLRQP